MVLELDNKIEQYNAEAKTKSDEENKNRAEEVQAMRNKIESYKHEATQDINNKGYDLLTPLSEKIENAIQGAARATGYEYVLDSSTNAGVLLAEGYDLLTDVKVALGIQH